MKIRCNFHNDDTASMQIYSDHAHCFGCGWHGSLEKLRMSMKNYPGTLPAQYKHNSAPENIAERLSLITQYPSKEIRGLEFPYDSWGYYIIYPDQKYYVKRLWEAHNGNKYRSPRGHKKPLFKVAELFGSSVLFVIEGQLNALTFQRGCVMWADIASPGAATDIARKDFVDYYSKYDNIVFVVDADAAGVVNAIKAREQLLPKGKKVAIHAMAEDLNDIYVKKERKDFEEECEKIMALCGVQELGRESNVLQTSTEDTS